MGKIRKVKPDLYRHLELSKAESASGLPLQLSFLAQSKTNRADIVRYLTRSQHKPNVLGSQFLRKYNRKAIIPPWSLKNPILEEPYPKN